jgi:hypothetical protein
MPSLEIAAARLRQGFFCALVSSFLLWSAHAGASTPQPVISGTPAASIVAGRYYAFTPKASGPSGHTLSFSITGQPKWAGFNRISGQLLGTPTAASAGRYSNIVITVSDGAARASLPPFAITVTAAASAAPSISGAPATTIAAGSYYAFTPKASGPKGHPLTFSISGQPAWAGFNRVSGQLLGTPTAANAGRYSNIVITVSDGAATASLAPFAITVSGAPPAATSSVTINWTPPTENVDGSTLTNLAGYHLYYGTSASSLTHVVNITNPGLAAYVVSDLSAATYYFAVASVNANGTESPRSTVVSAVVR